MSKWTGRELPAAPGNQTHSQTRQVALALDITDITLLQKNHYNIVKVALSINGSVCLSGDAIRGRMSARTTREVVIV